MEKSIFGALGTVLFLSCCLFLFDFVCLLPSPHRFHFLTNVPSPSSLFPDLSKPSLSCCGMVDSASNPLDVLWRAVNLVDSHSSGASSPGITLISTVGQTRKEKKEEKRKEEERKKRRSIPQPHDQIRITLHITQCHITSHRIRIHTLIRTHFNALCLVPPRVSVRIKALPLFFFFCVIGRSVSPSSSPLPLFHNSPDHASNLRKRVLQSETLKVDTTTSPQHAMATAG